MVTSVLVRDQLNSLISIHYLSLNTKNSLSLIECVDATLMPCYTLHRRYEKFFDNEQVSRLTHVYSLLYPHETINKVPMFHETVHEVKVLGLNAAVVCAYWTGTGGAVSPPCDVLRVGVVQHFVKHTVEIVSSSQEKRTVTHLFAFLHWYRVHPRATWFHPHIIVASLDMVTNGPAVFLPPCALIVDDADFDYGVSHKFYN